MSAMGKLVEAAGGVNALAAEMGVAPTFVWRAKREGHLPTGRAVELARKYKIDIAGLVKPAVADAIELDRATR